MKEAKSLKTDTKLKILIVPPLKQIEFAKLNAKLLWIDLIVKIF